MGTCFHGLACKRKPLMTRPWHSTRLLRIGLVGLCMLLAAWCVSYYRWGSCRASDTFGGHYLGGGVTSADGSINLWVGRPYQFLGVTYWSGFEFSHWKPGGILGHLSKFELISLEWEADDRLAIRIRFWVIVMIYAAFIVITLWLWQRRKRRIGERIRRQVRRTEGL